MSVTLVTPPASEPVTLAEVKSQRNITDVYSDTELTRLIAAVRSYVEGYTGRALITQTWDLFLNEFEPGICIPMPVLQSVTTVKYTDTDGNQQTLADTEYTVVINEQPGYIVPSYNNDWPDIRYVPEAVEIRFVAGYGAASTDVPEDLRNAIFLLLGLWHENTEDAQPFAMNQIPFGVRSLLDPYRVFRL
jgi:uncharacterized phiE125 gp8 family phage protein